MLNGSSPSGPGALAAASTGTTAPPKLTLKQIWQRLKDYFGDGFVAGTSPMRFNVHLCTTSKAPENDNIHYGVSIDDTAMPLFGSMGAVVQPPCTCADMAAVVAHIDAFIDAHDASQYAAPDAYKIYSAKDDASAAATCVYAMRDTLQWWVHWHGSLGREHYWKHLYVGFGTACDDLEIPVEHLVDGTFRLLGHTSHEVKEAMMREEGVSPADAEYMEMCVWRQYLAQWLEKVDPALRGLLLERTHVMSQWRIIGANTHGCAACLLTARGVAYDGNTDGAIEMSSYGDALSMDLAKEAMGLLKGEPTETVAGRDRARLKAELRWTYARIMNYLDTTENAKYLRRYSSAGLHFVPVNDRYQERLMGMKRRNLTPAMAELITSYAKEGFALPAELKKADAGAKEEAETGAETSGSDSNDSEVDLKAVGRRSFLSPFKRLSKVFH